MTILIVIVGLGIFINLFMRVGELERKVAELSKKGAGVSMAETAVPKPVTATEPPPAPGSFTSKILDIPTPPPSGVPKPPAQQAVPAQKDGSTEFAVGSRLLTGVGIVALILGVSFFLRYAFANNLISEQMRVALGAVFGILVIVIGHVLRKKYTQYAHGLIGAGLGILYLTTYAAYSFYGLLTVVPAFIILAIVILGGVALALSYNSKSLVGYAFFGAFVIPLILPLSTSVHALFIYLLVLNIGVLLTARFKIWPEFTVASLLGSCLLFLQWVYGPYTDAAYVTTVTYGTLIFIVYFITSLLNFVYRDRDYKGIDGALLYGIPMAYFILMLTIVHGRQDVALLAFLIGVFYIVLSFIIRVGFGGLGDLKKFSNAMLCVALPFIALATALHFEGTTITIFWAIEAVIMVLVGYALQTPANRVAGVILSVLTGIRILTSELALPNGAEAIFNTRSATLFFAVLMYLIIWRLYAGFVSKMDGVNGEEMKTGTLVPAFCLFAALFTWVTVESHDFIPQYELYLPMIWMILVAVMLSVGTWVKERLLRVLSYVLLLIAVIFALVSLSELPSTHAFIFNVRVATAVLMALLSGYIIWLFKVQAEVFSKEETKLTASLLLAANAGIIWAFSLEILSFYNAQIRTSSGDLRAIENTKRVALSGFWLVYALAGLGVGIFRKSIAVRYASIILFAITIFKIFLYDTANLSDVYRFVSFITLGIILLIAGFAYYKFKSRILEFVSGGDKGVA